MSESKDTHKSQALGHGVPTVRNYNLDSTLASVIDLVGGKATEAARESRAAISVPSPAMGGPSLLAVHVSTAEGGIA